MEVVKIGKFRIIKVDRIQNMSKEEKSLMYSFCFKLLVLFFNEMRVCRKVEFEKQ